MTDNETKFEGTSPWLYKRDTKGKVRRWRIVIDGSNYHVEQGLVDGATTSSKPTQAVVKNAGRANSTTPEAQAFKEAYAKWDKKRRSKGYQEKISGIDDVFQEPMLAHSFRDREKHVVYPVGVECKLNGVRALYRGDGKLVSRTNHQFHTVPHILKDIMNVLPPGIHLDGELFNPDLRENLNQIVELVSVAITEPDEERLRKSAELVQYWIYDAYNFTIGGVEITPETPFQDRRRYLIELFDRVADDEGLVDTTPSLGVLEYHLAESGEEVLEFEAALRKEGHEGAIVRVLDAPYEFKRSYNLLKVKTDLEGEFEIVELKPGKGNWAGCVKRVELKLEEPSTKGETTFHASIVGEQEYLRKMLAKKADLIGKVATVKYLSVSEFGVPQSARVITVRDYE